MGGVYDSSGERQGNSREEGENSWLYMPSGEVLLASSKLLGDFLQVVAALVNLSGFGPTASLGLSLKKR